VSLAAYFTKTEIERTASRQREQCKQQRVEMMADGNVPLDGVWTWAAVVLGALLLYCCCVPGWKACKACFYGEAIDVPVEDGRNDTEVEDPVPTVCAVVQHDRVNALAVLADAKICTPTNSVDSVEKFSHAEDDAAMLKAVLLTSLEEDTDGHGHGHGHGDGPEGDSAVVGHAVAEDVEDGGGNNSDEEYAAAQEWREAYAAARLSPAFWGPW